MPILAALLTSLAGSLAAFFAQWMTKKIAFGLAAVVVVGTLTGGLIAFMHGVVSPMWTAMVAAFPMTYWMGLAFPSAAGYCISALWTVWAACALYSWQNRALGIFVKA